jgi:hypothetical protein
MLEFLKSSGRRLRDGWFWPLVLLALPNCAFQVGGLPGDPTQFQPGSAPISDTVMCDIPKPFTTTCGSPADGISMSNAAVALAQGQHQNFGLDFSQAAQAQCGVNTPLKTEFFGPYPDGFPVCLNCQSQIPSTYPDGNAVCVAMCVDLVTKGEFDVSDPQSYCNANAHVSTNFDKTSCYHGLCSTGGTPLPNISDLDPRRPQELVKWTEQNGTKGGSNGNSITRTAGRSGNFDAGAYSEQTINHGDGWVEFSVSDNTKAYAVGLSHGATDTDETSSTIDFGILLQNGQVSVINESGIVGGSPFGPYNAGDRFRVKVVDNNDGTTTLSAVRVVGNCPQGIACTESFLAGPAIGPQPYYPLRVDVSLVDPGAILQNVTLVRIQDLP